MKTILVATDFSAASKRAFRFAVELAQATQAEVTALYVVNTTDLRFALKVGIPVDLATSQQLKQNVSAYIDRQFADLLRHSRGFNRVRTATARGVPADEILKVAKKLKADLIVVGTRGLSPAAGFLLGGTTQELIRRAACPVTTLRATKK